MRVLRSVNNTLIGKVNNLLTIRIFVRSATSSTLTTNPHGNQSSAEKRKSQEVVEIRKIGNEEHAKNGKAFVLC